MLAKTVSLHFAELCLSIENHQLKVVQDRIGHSRCYSLNMKERHKVVWAQGITMSNDTICTRREPCSVWNSKISRKMSRSNSTFTSKCPHISPWPRSKVKGPAELRLGSGAAGRATGCAGDHLTSSLRELTRRRRSMMQSKECQAYIVGGVHCTGIPMHRCTS